MNLSISHLTAWTVKGAGCRFIFCRGIIRYIPSRESWLTVADRIHHCLQQVVYLEWWPISRDSMMYGVSVILLISFLQDGKIYLYEAFALILVYVIYILSE
jgi:Ca2+/Na+ antiporter